MKYPFGKENYVSTGKAIVAKRKAFKEATKLAEENGFLDATGKTENTEETYVLSYDELSDYAVARGYLTKDAALDKNKVGELNQAVENNTLGTLPDADEMEIFKSAVSV